MLCNLCIVVKHLLYAIRIKFKITTRVIYTGFVTRLTRRVTAYHSGAPDSTPVFGGVRVIRSLVVCVCFVDRCLSFLAIVSSVLLRFTIMATQLYVRVTIVPTCGNHWHRVSGALRRWGLAHKTNLTHHFFSIEVPPVLSQASQW